MLKMGEAEKALAGNLKLDWMEKEVVLAKEKVESREDRAVVEENW
jgi:hypothetical protein